MSSVPWQHLGIDLKKTVLDPDLDSHLGMTHEKPLRHPVADDSLSSVGDPEGAQEDVFDLNNPVFCDVSEEDQEAAHCEPDLNEADACLKETTPCCHPDLNLNKATNSGKLVLLPDLNELPVGGLQRTSRKHYSDDTKRAVYAMLLAGSRGGCLPQGLTMQVSLAMDVSLRCVQRIWKAGQKGGGIHAVANKKANCGRKRIEVSLEAITAIPLKDRTTLENVARHLRMAKSTIFRRVKEGQIERRSIAIHPLLRNEEKMCHAQYYRDMLEQQFSSSSSFKSNNNVTQMGKKRFSGKMSNQKYYCAPGEEILKE